MKCDDFSCLVIKDSVYSLNLVVSLLKQFSEFVE
jgi:hypothetical protein